jgi:hypothetical protein
MQVILAAQQAGPGSWRSVRGGAVAALCCCTRTEVGLAPGDASESIVNHVPVALRADAHGAVVEALINQDVGPPVGAAVVQAAPAVPDMSMGVYKCMLWDSVDTRRHR